MHQLGGAPCPLKTELHCSEYERAHPREPHAEIRAYKLGKKRWSYNQIELRLSDVNGERQAHVKQTAHAADVDFPEPAQDSAVCFHVQLESGHKLRVHLFVVYDQLPPEAAPDAQQQQQQQQQQQEGQDRQPAEQRFSWTLVTRRDCSKGCQGNVLRSLQRFGRLGKRSWDNHGAQSEAAAPSAMKDPKYMYVSLDEACTHVDASAFRLVAGVYNRQGTCLLATAVSPPVRVLANNDVPTGAARIPLDARLPADWEGWAEPAPSAAGEDGTAVRLEGAAARPKRTRGGSLRHSARQLSSAELSHSSVSASEAHPRGGAAAALPQSVSAPVGLAMPGALPPPPAFCFGHLDRSSPLPLPGHGGGSQALLAAWHQQQGLEPPPGGVGPAAGAATRTLSLPAGPQPGQPQSHWQLRQATMHSGGADARSFSLPDPGLDLQPGGSGQWPHHPALQAGSPRAASMPVGDQAFSFLVPQHAAPAGMLPRPPSAEQQHEQLPHGFQQQVLDWGRLGGLGSLGPGAAGVGSLPLGSAQQLAAPYRLPQPGELLTASSGGAGLPSTLGGRGMGPAGSAGPALPLGADPAGAAAAAAADLLGSGPDGSSLPPPPGAQQQAAPLPRTGSDLLAGSTHSGSTTHLSGALEAQRKAARHAALLQHAEAQMLAAGRATASRAALQLPGSGGEAAAHLQLEAQLQQLHFKMQQQQQRDQLAAAISAAGLQLPFEPGALPALPAAGSGGATALFPSSLPLPGIARGQDLPFSLPFPQGGLDHAEVAALLDEVLGVP